MSSSPINGKRSTTPQDLSSEQLNKSPRTRYSIDLPPFPQDHGTSRAAKALFEDPLSPVPKKPSSRASAPYASSLLTPHDSAFKRISLTETPILRANPCFQRNEASLRPQPALSSPSPLRLDTPAGPPSPTTVFLPKPDFSCFEEKQDLPSSKTCPRAPARPRPSRSNVPDHSSEDGVRKICSQLNIPIGNLLSESGDESFVFQDNDNPKKVIKIFKNGNTDSRKKSFLETKETYDQSKEIEKNGIKILTTEFFENSTSGLYGQMQEKITPFILPRFHNHQSLLSDVAQDPKKYLDLLARLPQEETIRELLNRKDNNNNWTIGLDISPDNFGLDTNGQVVLFDWHLNPGDVARHADGLTREWNLIKEIRRTAEAAQKKDSE